ncbi:MAG: family 16 glycoside hydrolase [Anaerolineales bacterium]
MKRQRFIFVPAILLIASTLACSAVSNFLATPTPLPTSTPVPTLTPTASPFLLNETEFSSRSCFPSDGVSPSSDVERYSENGQFHMKVNTPSIIAWTVCEDKEFSDFVLEADVTKVDGPDNNAFGVIFRFNPDTNEFYNFSIGADGYYVLTMDGLNYKDPKFLVDWDTSSDIKQGAATNHIKLVVVGNKIEYYVNDTLLGEITDSSLSSGNIGFFASSFEEKGVHVSFDNVKVTEP